MTILDDPLASVGVHRTPRTQGPSRAANCSDTRPLALRVLQPEWQAAVLAVRGVGANTSLVTQLGEVGRWAPDHHRTDVLVVRAVAADCADLRN